MKTVFNMTTSEEDLNRFESRADFEVFSKAFDGVELMCFGEDERGILSPEKIIGLHMHFFPFWLDFWNGNEEALLREFDRKENWEQCYGGVTKEALICSFRKDLEDAHRYGAEYVVFHISESSVEESFTFAYRHTDEEVVDAAAELLNEVFREEDGKLVLLMENLWQPGLQFTRSEITKRLLEKVNYPNKGIMLDTGHLMHTNLNLRTQEEGLAYIHQMLDAHGDLCSVVRGIHLNQSLTGEYCQEIIKNPPPMENSYQGRYSQMFFHAFAVDRHEPFTCPGVKRLVERIRPEYLNFELISADREQHQEYLQRQLRALGRI